MAPRPLFRNATHAPGFIPAPKPYVWTRIEPNEEFESERYPGAWVEALNPEAEAILEAALAAKKRKTLAPEGARNDTLIKPPSNTGMQAAPNVEHYAPAPPNPDDTHRPPPRRRAAANSPSR